MSALEQRFAKAGKPLDSSALRNLRLMKTADGTEYPTNGLLILLGYFDHVRTQCARFKGSNMDVFSDRKEYTGNVLGQLEQTLAFVKNHLNLRGEIQGLQRTDTLEIPEAALREALVNAYVHRDYSNTGRNIKVGIYDNKVHIISPGGLPPALTIADVSGGRSEVRNRVVARVFKELGFIEQWGTGIARIRSACQQAGLEPPQIAEKGDFVDVELYRFVASAAVGVAAGVEGAEETGAESDNTAGVNGRKRAQTDANGRLRWLGRRCQTRAADDK